jgi:hypothetical protein
MRRTPISISQILRCADDYHARTGRWPEGDCRERVEGIESRPTWQSVNHALRFGYRGLPRGSSLAQLLARYRGVRNRKALPHFTIRQIILWADLHQERTGSWPTDRSGPVADAPGETWCAVAIALAHGQRGLPGGTTLAQLLEERRQRRHSQHAPPLTLAQILSWADAHHARTGKWPQSVSGSIPESPGETWHSVNNALRAGRRGLPGGSSLAQLLADQRKVRNNVNLPRLTLNQVLLWADAHYRRTGKWPWRASGPILCSGGETWSHIDSALHQGNRGLPGGLSLSRLLAEHRGVRTRAHCPELTCRQILCWADAHHDRTGCWPTRRTGAIPEAPSESWAKVHSALYHGFRGFAGGTTLHRFLCQHRAIHLQPRMLAEMSDSMLQ